MLDLFGLLACTGVSHAESNEWLDLVVDSQIFQSVVETLELSESQDKIANNLFNEYRTRIDDVSRNLSESNAGLEKQIAELDEARNAAGPLTDSPERALLMKQYLAAVASANIAADASLDRFFADLSLILTDTQKDQLPELRRGIRRGLYFRRMTKAEFPDFLRGVDITDLVETAAKSEKELQELLQPANPDQVGEVVAKAQIELASILDEYVLALDSIVSERFASTRDLTPSDEGGKVYYLDENDRETRNWKRHRISQWTRLFDVNNGTSQRIAVLLEENLGLAARSKWEEQFARAYAPRLYAPTFCDSLPDWITARPAITMEQRKASLELHAAYLTNRQLRRKQAFDAGVAAVRSEGFVDGQTRECGKYAEMIESLRSLDAALIRQVATVLGDPLGSDLVADSKAAFH